MAMILFRLTLSVQLNFWIICEIKFPCFKIYLLKNCPEIENNDNININKLKLTIHFSNIICVAH